MSKKNPKLMALTASALALPAFQQSSNAAGPVATPEFSARFSNYSEDDLEHGFWSGEGSKERYTINVAQFRYLEAYDDKLEYGVDFLAETMSGATPWFIKPDKVDKQTPKARMSGATVQDTRYDIGLSGKLFEKKKIYSGGVGLSVEDDYTSVSGNVGVSKDSADKMRTYDYGVSTSFDFIEPEVDNVVIQDSFSRQKQKYSVFAGLSQIINKVSVVNTSVSLTVQNGYLDDPYKDVYHPNDLPQGDFSAVAANDNRPSTRIQATWLTQYRHFYNEWDGASHTDFRLYMDDWGVVSETLEVGWYQNIPVEREAIVGVSFRYYQQSEADFYEIYSLDPYHEGEQSSDYRLSTYGALSFKVTGQVKIGSNWTARANFERYDSSSNYSLFDVPSPNPALVDYTRFGIGFDYKFD